MPREIVHWEIAERVREALEQNGAPTVAAALHTFSPEFHLGAMLPDAPYYHRWGRSEFERIAEVLHGAHGEDTFAPIRAGASVVPTLPIDQRGRLWAFLVGTLTHCVVDVIFHPFIYFLTGDYYSPDKKLRTRAREKHRAFESILDVWWTKRYSSPEHERFQSYLERCSPMVWEALGASIEGSNGILWRESFRDIALLQNIFLNPFLGRGAALLALLAPQTIGERYALFRYGHDWPPEWFDDLFLMRHPVTGESSQVSLDELRARAISRCVELLLSWEESVRDCKNISILQGVVGPSLNSGLIGTDKDDMRYFTEHPLL